MTLVKSDIGGNISVKFSFSLHDFDNRISQIYLTLTVQTTDKSALPGPFSRSSYIVMCTSDSGE